VCVCVCVCEADWSLESDAEIKNAWVLCCTIYFHACHLRMGRNLPFTIKPFDARSKCPQYSLKDLLICIFLASDFEWRSVFSFYYTVHSLVFQHQRVKCTIVSNHSDQSLFPITEPKETAVDIGSSGISARITIQKCSFGGRSERASSCHAALTLNIHVSWYMFSVA